MIGNLRDTLTEINQSTAPPNVGPHPLTGEPGTNLIKPGGRSLH
jgi:hypothetical protein